MHFSFDKIGYFFIFSRASFICELLVLCLLLTFLFRFRYVEVYKFFYVLGIIIALICICIAFFAPNLSVFSDYGIFAFYI